MANPVHRILTKKERNQLREMSRADRLEALREELHQEAEFWYESARIQEEGLPEDSVGAIYYDLMGPISRGWLVLYPRQR